MIQHHALKTNAILASWTRNKDNRTNKCKTCGQTEDIMQLFAYCQKANAVWENYRSIITGISPNQHFSPKHCTLGININNKNINNQTKLLNLTIINYITYEIWQARNKKQFENITTPKEQIILNINNNIKNLIQLKYNHLKNEDLQDFKNKYCINKALCYIKNKTLNFNLQGK